MSYDPFMKKIDMATLIKYQSLASKKYHSLDDYEKLTVKRSINTSLFIIECVKKVPFEVLELAIYMKVTDKSMLQLMHLYEYQIEEAALHPESFIDNLHFFYKQTAYKILENPRDFFDFLDFIIRKERERKEYEEIFNGYVSLLLQQCTYLGFVKGLKEKICCGLSTDNQIIFKDDIHPYSDCGSYELEGILNSSFESNKGKLRLETLKKAYKKYGYIINNLTDVEYLDSTSRGYSNNHFMMMNYINEHLLYMLPDTEYKNIDPNLPRQWVNTELYIEQLSKRKYVLPSNGIEALYFNAGEIEKIHFQEVYKDEKIILLYKVFSNLNGEYSGYYDTKTHDFYSMYEDTNLEQYHYVLKSFILENYYTLTCEPTIDKKKLTVLKQVEDINKIDSYYAKQPVVCYLYKKEHKTDKTKNSLKHYDRNNYQSEKKNINGFIRKLPIGQQASFEANRLAVELGYELSEDQTFVRPFEKHVLKIKEI